MESYLELVQRFRYIVPVLCTALLILGWWAARRDRPLRLVGGLVTLGLVFTALLSLMNYTAPHVQFKRYTNSYDMFHYYLPTRYAREVGYMGMYEAAVAAADEIGVRPTEKVRDLRTGQHVPYAKVLKGSARVRARFSPTRWAEWVEDIRYFSTHVSRKTWAQMLEDRGYNATPVWTMVGGAFANQVRADSPHGLLWLSLIDVGFWLAAFTAIGLAFGPRPLCVVIAMLGVHYVTSFVPLKAAFMRIDWVCCLLGALAMEKRGRPALAGALVAWAGVMRVFPFVFAFGPAVMLVHSWWKTRRLDRGPLRFLVSMTLVTVVMLTASVFATSTTYWRGFLQKIGELSQVYSNWRVGFAYLLAGSWDGKGWGGVELPEFAQRYGWLLTSLRAVIVVACAGLVIRLKESWERLIIGFFLMFFLVGALYYYYVVLLVPTLWLAVKAGEGRNADGRAIAVIAWMFIGSTLDFLSFEKWGRSAGTYFLVSCTLLIQILGMAWIMVRPKPQDVVGQPATQASSLPDQSSPAASAPAPA